ncbi:FG-GAP repeat domain-containing protein [Fontivita pretiosa]|uniref:FG-GAP repeat domain-containing protein n=1 Tax=Fontivita pretiosa TaxID=2989684 RepID=UPI003D17D358
MQTRIMYRLVAATMLGLVVLPMQPASGGSRWVEESWSDFRDGSFTDAGSNAYVSHRGRIQIITRWDFNNDGHLDILLPAGHGYDEKSNTYVYLNSGQDIDGRSRIELPASGSVAGLVLDLNRDGYNDLAVANVANSHFRQTNAFIYWGGPDGLSVRHRTDLPAFAATGLAAGDFNHDGLSDLALACQWQAGGPLKLSGSKTSFIYWNSPQGFSVDRRTPITLAEGRIPTGVAAGDLDGDGTDDLVLLAGDRVELLYSSRGALENVEKSDARVVLSVGASAAAIADFNRDGRSDLALCAGGGVSVLLRDEAGYSTDRAIQLKVPAPSGIAVADFDRDQYPDIAVASGQSAGGVAWTDSLLFFGDGKDFSTRQPLSLPTLGASGVSAGDLNADGYPDLVFSNRSVINYHSLLSYVYWNDRGTFRAAHRTQLPTEEAAGSAVGDLNHDGRPDVVFFNGDGGIHDGPAISRLYWGDGTRNFSPKRSLEFMTHHIFGFGHADLDDDGFVDLVLSQATTIKGVPHTQNGTIIYWGKTAGFSPPSHLSMEIGYGGVRIADLNRDGWLDLVAGGASQDPADPGRFGLTIFYGSSAGFEHARRTVIALGEKAMIRTPLLMDLNRDGWLDLAGQIIPSGAPNPGGPTKIWWGSAEGFSAERASVLDVDQSEQLMYLQGADFNRDGWLDLLIPNRGGGDTIEKPSYVYYGSPSGFSRDRREIIMGSAPYDNCVADFDKDGWLDIFLCAYGAVEGNAPSLIYWGGPRGFGQRPRTELPTYGSSGADPLDYDGDGWLDLLIANHRRGGFTDQPLPHRHQTVSMLYWGGPKGFSANNRLEFATYGPSGLNVRDPGNSYDRGLYEDYISSAHEIPSGQKPHRIEWDAQTSHGTAVRFQIRTAQTKEALDAAPWTGPRGPQSWFTRSGARVKGLAGRWVQYRARLLTPNAAASPYLTRVAISFE